MDMSSFGKYFCPAGWKEKLKTPCPFMRRKQVCIDVEAFLEKAWSFGRWRVSICAPVAVTAFWKSLVKIASILLHVIFDKRNGVLLLLLYVYFLLILINPQSTLCSSSRWNKYFLIRRRPGWSTWYEASNNWIHFELIGSLIVQFNWSLGFN